MIWKSRKNISTLTIGDPDANFEIGDKITINIGESGSHAEIVKIISIEGTTLKVRRVK